MLIKRLLILTPLAVVLFFAIAFGIARTNFDRKVNQLVLSSIGDAEKLNPLLSVDSASSDINGFVFNGLMKYNENQELIGELAERWTIEQDTWFYLKPEATVSPAQVIHLIRQNLGQDGLEREQISRLDAASHRGVRLRLRRAGKYIEKPLLAIVSENGLLPVNTLTIMVNTKQKLSSGEDASADLLVGSITDAINQEAALREQFLEIVPDASFRFQIVALGDIGLLRQRLEELSRALVKVKATGEKGAEKKAAAFTVAAVRRELFVHEPIVTFYLRENVRWHDGTPFTSADVEFTFQTVMDERTNTVRRPMFELVKKLTAVGPFQVRVRYKQPFAPSLPNWSIGIIARHIFENQDINISPHNRKPIGTGPFKFKEWISDEKITLVANPEYFDGRPFLDQISYRIIPEPPLKELEFVTKGVDLDAPQPHQYERISKDPRFRVYERLANGYTYIGWNQRLDLFKDLRVRRALTHAINRQEIVEFLLNGLGVTSTGPFPPQMWYANTDITPLAYDPKKAKALLAEAGWADSDGDGILDKDGKPFAFTLMTNNGNVIRQNVAVLVQRALQQIGIQVEIELYEWAVFIRDKINPRDFEACVLGWSLSLDPDVYELWHSSQRDKGFNFVDYHNPEVDRLLELGRTVYDQQQQKTIYNKIHKLIYDEQPYTFLFVAKGTPTLHRDEFRIRRRTPRGQLNEEVKMTKVGLLYYLNKWYRTRKNLALTP